MSGATLERRLANYRAAVRGDPERTAADRARAMGLASVMAEAVDGEIVGGGAGSVVRCEPLTVVLPIDRDALAVLPGQPPADAPLVCLDTETTGLATAAGTMAFLIGLGWWEGDRFRQAQLLLPDQPDEPALLALLESYIPQSAWLVTYNGRGFDWPLLVTRYRMARRDPPVHAGHLDLLPFVRRVFKHRMTDARLRTVETELLGVLRPEDVDGWEIPGRYLDFLRTGAAGPLRDVVRHNREDVRSLARLLSHMTVQFGDDGGRRSAHPGDLAGLARAFSRDRRIEEALACLEVALAQRAPVPTAPDDDAWWEPRRPVDFGGKRPRLAPLATPLRQDSPWTDEQIMIERARLLRRLGRFADAADVWRALGAGLGPFAPHAWIEVSKLLEHRLADPVGALAAVERALGVVNRRRALGRPDPRFANEVGVRLGRLRTRVATSGARRSRAGTGDGREPRVDVGEIGHRTEPGPFDDERRGGRGKSQVGPSAAVRGGA